jgi:hypothetical protein
MKMSNVTNIFTRSGHVLAAYFERISILGFTIFKFERADSACAYSPNLVGVEKPIRKYHWSAPYLAVTSAMVSSESLSYFKHPFTAAK